MKSLEKARTLKLPNREEVINRSQSVQKFWQENKSILADAWKEWEKEVELPQLDENLIDNDLRENINRCWDNPKEENILRENINEVSHDVYEFQLFNPEKLIEIRKYFHLIENANIPLRAPYGIVLNRKGVMLDQRSEGYLAADSFQHFYQILIDKYMRPISRFLFPEIVGFDTQTFGFSIQYQPGLDTSIRMHTDASSVTLNINLNLPNELYEGSEVDFHNPKDNKIKRAVFSPGMALLHKGSVAHMAHPILKGERKNLVLWLYGDGMSTSRFSDSSLIISPEQRWIIPQKEYDSYSPF